MNAKLGLLLGCLIAGSTAMAQPPGNGDGPRDGKRGEKRQMLLEKFDADGDGVLSDAEKETAKEARRAKMEEKRQAHILKRFDEDGDGSLNDAEQARADEAKARMLERFDQDGDGQLSREEHKAARKAKGRKHKDGKCNKGDRGGKGAPGQESI